MDQTGRLGRRGLLQASLAGALAGCRHRQGGQIRARSAIGAHPRADRPDLRHHRLPARLSSRGAARRCRAVGDTLVVHNYGHGGSGWSLCWGSARGPYGLACGRARSRGDRLRRAGADRRHLAQRAGARVTIYASERCPRRPRPAPPANGRPNSRVALANAAAPDFAAIWEEMARTAFKTHRDYLGLPGTPVEWIDQYSVSGELPRTRQVSEKRPSASAPAVGSRAMAA